MKLKQRKKGPQKLINWALRDLDIVQVFVDWSFYYFLIFFLPTSVSPRKCLFFPFLVLPVVDFGREMTMMVVTSVWFVCCHSPVFFIHFFFLSLFLFRHLFDHNEVSKAKHETIQKVFDTGHIPVSRVVFPVALVFYLCLSCSPLFFPPVRNNWISMNMPS